MTAAKRPQPENKPSFLLTKEENEQLFQLIGMRCKSLATAVIQLYLADSNHWTKRHCGVLCLIKDNTKKSYFMRVYCMDSLRPLWEHELYNQFEYKAPRPYFHTFEGEECQVGMNFADEGEAEFFLSAVKEHLRQKIEKRERRRSQQTQVVPQAKFQHKTASNGSAVQTVAPPPAPVPAATSMIQFSSKKNNKKDKKKLTKADIGLPSNFTHLSHVGWDPNKGFALDNVEPHLMQFFQKAGVSERQLQDKETRDFIYDFIDKNGIQAIWESSQSTTSTNAYPPPVPARNPPTPQTTRTAPPAPPATPPTVAAPPPPSRVVASPSAAPPAPPHRAPPPVKTQFHAVPPPPPVSAGPPPPPLPSSVPPPPPMMMSTSASTAPQSSHPPPAAAPVQQHDTRGALLDAIKGGAKLKPVGEAETRPKPAVGGRNDLLDQIRAGKELKPVESSQVKAAQSSEEIMDGMAGALARALQERSRVIHSDSESEAEEEEDDDWDD